MTFRVMTYNINNRVNADSLATDTLGLWQIVQEQHPDILCLHEAPIVARNPVGDSLDAYFGYHEEKPDHNRIALYSRFPFRNFIHYPALGEVEVPETDSLIEVEIKNLKHGMPVFSAEIEVEKDKWITVFSSHLRSNAYSVARRSMDHDSTTWKDGIPLYYKNYKIAHAIRNWEAATVRHHLDSILSLNIPVVLAGDLNDFSGSDCINLLTGVNGLRSKVEGLRSEGEGQRSKVEGQRSEGESLLLRDAWWERGNGFGVTYDEWHLKIRIDHILISKHFEVNQIWVPRYGLSDHYPLVADVCLVE